MRPDLPDRLKRAAEAFARASSMEGDARTVGAACALALSIYGPLFAEAREALRELAE